MAEAAVDEIVVTDLVHLPAKEPGLSSMTVERLSEARQIIRSGTADAIIDVLIYTDALVAVAREKRAADVAREAATTRIEAARRLGEMVTSASDPERLWGIIPNRFCRCDELAAIPERLFTKVVCALVEVESACSIPNVIRRARIESLKKVEHGIYVAFDGSYWIAESGGRRRTHIHHGGLEEARRRLGLRDHPGARKLDAAYSMARMHASSLSQLGREFTGETRRIISEAELAQAKVAELLDAAIKVVVEPRPN